MSQSDSHEDAFWNVHGHDTDMELPTYIQRGAVVQTYVETIATVVTAPTVAETWTLSKAGFRRSDS
jgi:hypothetical protein